MSLEQATARCKKKTEEPHHSSRIYTKPWKLPVSNETSHLMQADPRGHWSQSAHGSLFAFKWQVGNIFFSKIVDKHIPKWLSLNRSPRCVFAYCGAGLVNSPVFLGRKKKKNSWEATSWLPNKAPHGVPSQFLRQEQTLADWVIYLLPPSLPNQAYGPPGQAEHQRELAQGFLSLTDWAYDTNESKQVRRSVCLSTRT